MAEYISREEADLLLLKKAEDYSKMDANYAVSIIQGDRSIIRSIPAADVRENMRGEWVFEKGDNKTCVDGWMCTNCKHGFHTNVPYFSDFNYCPNCGADMRGETDG